MTYLPTQEDLALLTNRSKDLYCRIDLLDSDYYIVDSLEGLAMSGSLSIDADSDTRRTFNVDIHPKKGSEISEYSVEDWIDKMIRVYVGIKTPVSKLQAKNSIIDVDGYINKVNSLNSYLNKVDTQIKKKDEYISSLSAQKKVIQDIKDAGLEKYGNINNVDRPVFYWTDATAKQYKPFYDEHEGIEVGGYSTVLGCDDEFDGLQIAYAILTVKDNTLVPIVESAMEAYLKGILEKAKKKSGGLTSANILAADHEGLKGYTLEYGTKNKVDVFIHDMIAAVEGQTINKVKLAKVDVSAIAGWSDEELKEEYGKTSVFAGKDMHTLQDSVIQAADEYQRVYDKLWDEIVDPNILSADAETVSSCYTDVEGIHWYDKGVFVIKENGITYDATTNTLSLSCTDLTAWLDGSFGGKLTGFQTIIYRFQQTADKKDDMTRPQKIKKCIVDTFKLSGLTKYCIDYWERYIPHDMEYNAGTTIWEILTELRDLYFPFEMHFDGDTFVCKEIPSGINDPTVLDADLFADLVISENASVDYSQVKNCVEVFGATIDSDVFAYGKETDNDNQPVSNYVKYITDSNELSEMWKDMASIWTHSFTGKCPTQALKFTFENQDFTTSSSISISFICPKTITLKDPNDIFFEIVNTITVEDTNNGEHTTQTTVQKIGIRHLYKSATDKYGEDQLVDKDFTLIGDRYYVFKIEPSIIKTVPASKADDVEYNDKGEMVMTAEKGLDDDGNVFYKENRFYFLGQQQSHAMAKFVDSVPSENQQDADKKSENCDNLKYVAVTNPTDFSGSYNSRMTIEKIGRRNEILSGGDYDNYTTDERTMEVTEYKLWQSTRLTDTVQLQMLLVPWLDVNERIDYAARYMKNKAAVEWLIKKIDFNLGEGTMNVTMCRYYPYYPYIVQGKYDEDYIS